MVFPKTSSSVFISTNLDYVLRCLGVKQLILAGSLTDQCVESAVRDACDMNYLVTLVTGESQQSTVCVPVVSIISAGSYKCIDLGTLQIVAPHTARNVMTTP